MLKGLSQKNEFVYSLVEYLQSKYRTEYYRVSGSGSFEGKNIDGAYCSVCRDSDDLNGFSFRKDLCNFVPFDGIDVLKDIYEFACLDSDIYSVFDEDRRLKIRFGDKDYLVTSFIDGGYAGVIGVSFVELPDLL